MCSQLPYKDDASDVIQSLAINAMNTQHALLKREESGMYNAATGECIASIYIVRLNSPDPFPPFGCGVWA